MINHFLKHILDDFDTSVSIDFEENLFTYFSNNEKVISANGIELLIFYLPNQRELAQGFQRLYPNYNWKIIEMPNLFYQLDLKSKTRIIKKFSTKTFSLMCENILEFKFEMLYSFRKFSFYYDNSHFTSHVGSLFLMLNLKILDFKNYSNKVLYYSIHQNLLSIDLVKSGSSYHKLEMLLMKDKLVLTPSLCKVKFDWRNKVFVKKDFNEYLRRYSPVSHFVNETLLNKGNARRIVILIQTYQEQQIIESFIKSWENYCDGFILLDDGSSDLTYENFNSEKLLIKVKMERVCFNDLKNRNFLLKICSFVSSETFLFLDADELLDCRYYKIPFGKISRSSHFIGGVYIVNEWESSLYNPYLYDSNRNSKNGIWVRWRLFKNIGYCQINESKRLHFSVAPYNKDKHLLKILIIHKGYLGEVKRSDKNKFYHQEDTNFNNNLKSGVYYTFHQTFYSLKKISDVRSKNIVYKKIYAK